MERYLVNSEDKKVHMSFSMLYYTRESLAFPTSFPHPPSPAGSIIGKKSAETLKSLVLDVKFGRGAFMKTKEEAEELAREMVNVGNGIGMKTTGKQCASGYIFLEILFLITNADVIYIYRKDRSVFLLEGSSFKLKSFFYKLTHKQLIS